VDRKRMGRRYEELAERVGFRVSPQALVRELRTADQQKVEILRALARESELVVMDEPTASLTTEETRVLLAAVRHLADRGASVVFVSHHLKDVLEVSDEITVLKDGRHVKTVPAAGESEDSLVTAMLGQSLDVIFPPRPQVPSQAPVVLAVEGVSTGSGVADVSLEVRAGEIVGIAGLVGSGRTELLRAICGADHVSSGRIRVAGEVVRVRSPREAQRLGIALLPESRKDEGLMMDRSIRENVTLPHLGGLTVAGVIRRGAERTQAEEVSRDLRIKAASLDVPVRQLSGGNQQKVMFARCLFGKPRLLLVDEPTRGVDIGAKRAIYELLNELAESGVGVLLVSSELEEVLELSHRIVVMNRGRAVSTLDAHEATEDAVMRAAFATTTERTQK